VRSLPALVGRTASAWGILAPALYVVIGVATVAIVRGDPKFALAGGSAWALAAELGAGLLLIAAALAAPGARAGHARFAGLVIVAALAWPLQEWAVPAAASGLFTAGLLLHAAWPPLLGAAALRGPDERPLSRSAVLVLACAFTTSIGVLGAGSAAFFDPRAQGCLECPRNRVLIAGDANTWHDLGQAGLTLSAVWIAGFAALAVTRLVRASPARRRVAAPVLVPTVAALVLFGIDALHGRPRGFLSNDPTDRALWAGEIAALALVAAGVAWGPVRTRRARSALARLVVDLGASPAPGGLRGLLAGTLDDPALELVHGVEDGGGWIDADGHTVTVSTGPEREVTRIVGGDRGVSAVLHRRGLLDDPALTAEIARAARLALDHERLHATRRAHLEALRTSRARIVATADAERRRLEHDLHDGAQQRLVTLAIGVRLARRHHAADDPELDAELATAEHELQAVVGELRELAHGLFPAALDEEGLAAAIEGLAEHEPRLVPGTLPRERCPPHIESAAYFLVREALRLAPAGDVNVDAHRRNGRLVVELRAESAFAGLSVRVEDRVGAVGGTISSNADHIRAELPCAS
jgi:signal transduction histidine kinase